MKGDIIFITYEMFEMIVKNPQSSFDSTVLIIDEFDELIFKTTYFGSKTKETLERCHGVFSFTGSEIN